MGVFFRCLALFAFCWKLLPVPKITEQVPGIFPIVQSHYTESTSNRPEKISAVVNEVYIPWELFLVQLWEFVKHPQGDPVVRCAFLRIYIIFASLRPPQMFSQTHAKDDSDYREHCYDTKAQPQGILGRKDAMARSEILASSKLGHLQYTLYSYLTAKYRYSFEAREDEV